MHIHKRTIALFLLCLLAGLGIISVITWLPSFALHAVAAAVMATAAAILVSLRKNRRLVATSKRTHHLDASRIQAGVEDLKGQLTRLAADVDAIKKPAPKSTPKKEHGPASWRNNPAVPELESSGIYVDTFYRAVGLGWFARELDAMSHYLSVGMKQLIGPNAFVDPAWLPAKIVSAMKQGRGAEVVAYLSTTTDALGPAFDPAYLPSGLTDGATSGPLASFLASIDEETLLPVSPDSPYFGVRARDYEAAITSEAMHIAKARKLRQRREITTWDADAETVWKERIRRGGVAVPHRPLVTVIMPALNRGDMISTAIDSLRAQSYTKWELVVVDDHSTDNTLEVAEGYAASDPRIRVLSNAETGVSAGRNTGLSEAAGEYIAFLDSDNSWRPDFLELAVLGALAEGSPWVYAASRVTGVPGSPTIYRCFEGNREHLLVQNHIDMNVMLVSADLVRSVGGFDTSLKRWVDHDLALKLSTKTDPQYLPFIGCDYEHSAQRKDRITVKESPHWEWVVLANHMLDWEEAARAPRVPGRISVVIPTYDDYKMTLAAVDSVLSSAKGEDVEVIVVDNGSSPHVSSVLARNLVARPGVVFRRLVRNYNFSIGCNLGAIASSGEFIFFLNNDTLMRRGTITSLARQLADPAVAGVQPLLVYSDDTIQAAGTVFPARDVLPVHALTGMSIDDARKVGSYPFRAITAAAMMLRAEDVIDMRGFDPIFVNGMEDVDLCLRLLRKRWAGFRLDTATAITHLESKTPGRDKAIPENRVQFMRRWRGKLPDPDTSLFERLGLAVTGVHSDGVVQPVATTRVQYARRADLARRWAIKIAAIAGPQGDLWGDTHFAESLASSLRARGEEVVVYRHGTGGAQTGLYDDVNLVLRGLDRVAPTPGKVNVMWIISHPEDITADELSGFDLVYAASVKWAAWASAEFGQEVRPLLQATDSSIFAWDEYRPEPSCDLVFVGANSYNRTREGVAAAVDAGVGLAVYGPGWSDCLPEGMCRGDYVNNGELAAVYRSGRYVLADHWDDMARDGFIQNRLFDAVAAGCQVLSDEVEGIEELFGPAARVYRNWRDISEAIASPDTDRQTMRDIAERVRREHSFDARADQLITDVCRVEAERPDPRGAGLY